MKTCSRCRKDKDNSNFGPDKRSSDGLRCECYECRRQTRMANRDKILAAEKASQQKHRIARLEGRRKHYYKYRTIILAKQLERQKQRLLSDINYRLIRRLRNRVYYALKGFKKPETTQQLLGCSLDVFKMHLEERFLPGMTWDNYGEWHVDHIRPCASFDLSKPQERAECFHYLNTQPLWASDNIRKKDSDLGHLSQDSVS